MQEEYNFCLIGKEPAYRIRCDSCGKTSLISKEHKRYCPICGPGAITPITIERIGETHER